MVFGIALIWGTTGKMNFNDLAQVSPQFLDNKIFLIGVLFLLAGLGFKIAAVPFQIWAPDVYQGAPTPTTAFLAVGSKAAGFVLVVARFVHRRSRRHRALDGFPHRHLRADHSLRKPLRAAAAQSETPDGLFQHFARGLSVAGRGGAERERPIGGHVLSGGIFVHRGRRVHRDRAGHAPSGR